MRTKWLVWILLLLPITVAALPVTYQLSLCYGNICQQTTPTCTVPDFCEITDVSEILGQYCMVPAQPGALTTIPTWNAKLLAVDGREKITQLTETEYLDFLKLDKGKIYTMCDGVEVVSDGTQFYSCGTGKFYSYGNEITTTTFPTTLAISAHDYTCKNGVITECGSGTTLATGNNYNTKDCCTDGPKSNYNSPGSGFACWNDQPIDLGDSPATGVINAGGLFVGCKTNINTLDDYTGQPLVTNYNQCANVLKEGLGLGKNAYCNPRGQWEQTTETAGTQLMLKTLKWQPGTGIETNNCCPENKCWNGQNCQIRGTYYKLGEKGYLCE